MPEKHMPALPDAPLALRRQTSANVMIQDMCVRQTRCCLKNHARCGQLTRARPGRGVGGGNLGLVSIIVQPGDLAAAHQAVQIQVQLLLTCAHTVGTV